MKTRLMATQYKLQQWDAIIQECRASGLMIKDWCQQNNIKKDHFYYWQRKVRQAACQPLTETELSSQKFAEIPSVITGTTAVDSFRGELTILVGGTVVTVSKGTDLNLLKSVIEVLKNA